MEDAQIIDLYWQRSEDAIPETESKYGRYCRAIADNVLSNTLDAEECVNDTWLAAWNSMPTNRPATLPPYLGKISRNLALDRLAARRAAKRGGDQTDAVLDELAECLPGGEDPESAAEVKELADRINRFLRTLPETERLIFVSRYWYMAPIEETAVRFGFTRVKTAAMLHRTRKKLHTQLKKEGWL